MKNIIIFKNDRLGDLFHSLNGINNIMNEHKDDNIEIYLSNYSKSFSFLFDKTNVKINYLNYSLSLIEKLKIFKIFLNNSIDKVFILSPKNYFFYLSLFFKKTKFYGITIKEKNKERPITYINKFLFKFRTNNRKVKKRGESIKYIIEDLCSNNLQSNDRMININPKCNFNFEFFLQNKYCHFHFKKFLYEKKIGHFLI